MFVNTLSSYPPDFRSLGDAVRGIFSFVRHFMGLSFPPRVFTSHDMVGPRLSYTPEI